MHLLVNLQKWVDKHPNRLPVKEQMRWSINEAWMTSGLERKNSIESVGIGRVTLVEYAIQTMRCSKSESFLTRSQAGQPSDAAVVKDIEIKVRHHPGSNVKETERGRKERDLAECEVFYFVCECLSQ